MYGVPCHSDKILKVDVATGTCTTLGLSVTGGGPLPAGKKRPDGKYKYLGGVNGTDGAIYFMPADADFVTRLDPLTGEVKTIGTSFEGEEINHTKWQNGFMAHDK